MAEVAKLTALKVSKLSKPGRYGDGAGLWLQVSRSGTKAWILRYMLHGRAREMGLGPLHTVSLADARLRAREARTKLLNGVDPIDERLQNRLRMRADAARRVTFRAAAEQFIAAHEAGWRNAKHAAQWSASLEAYAFEVIGEASVAAIDTPHVMQVLEPIWREKPETASRVRGRIEAVLDWAAARRLREAENPARWRGHLDKLLPPRSKVRTVRHHPAMAFTDVPRFVSELRAKNGISARALEFAILTAARTGEVIGAMWPEIDLDAGVWTIPRERMKSGREHRVPLSPRASAIIKALPAVKGDGHVFPGGRKGSGLSNMALLELLRDMRGPGLTVHGFRSSFRDWAGETTAYPREVAEAVLAHVIGDRAEQAYRRGDALEKRRGLMIEWAAYLDAAG